MNDDPISILQTKLDKSQINLAIILGKLQELRGGPADQLTEGEKMRTVFYQGKIVKKEDLEKQRDDIYTEIANLEDEIYILKTGKNRKK